MFLFHSTDLLIEKLSNNTQLLQAPQNKIFNFINYSIKSYIVTTFFYTNLIQSKTC